MIKHENWPIGVCTWSLGNDFAKISELRKQTGLECIHLGLDGAMPDDIENWTITATMIGFAQEDYSTLETTRATGGIVPNDCWDENKKHVAEGIEKTSQLGAKYLEFHFGFIDDTDAELLDKVKLLADAAGEKGVTLLMETGQETAGQLKRFLEKLDHPAVGVNFDPANMILYGKGNPADAVRVLSPWIKHVHIKDAVAADTPGAWGTEVAWGNGQVNPAVFLAALKEFGFDGALAIEREAGADRIEDIKLAIERLVK